MVCSTLGLESHLGMNRKGKARVGGPGGSALAIQISQTGWKDVIYLSSLAGMLDFLLT